MCYIPCKEEQAVIDEIKKYYVGDAGDFEPIFSEDCPKELLEAREYWIQYHKDHFFEEISDSYKILD